MAERFVDCLQAFARVLLDEAYAYNSMSHGLAVFPSTAEVHVVGDDEVVHRLGHGRSIAFLHHGRWEPKKAVQQHRTWSRTIRWVDLTEAVGMIQAGIFLIDAMLGIGRAGYLGTPLGDLAFPAVPPGDPRRRPRTGPVHTVTTPLATEHRVK